MFLKLNTVLRIVLLLTSLGDTFASVKIVSSNFVVPLTLCHTHLLAFDPVTPRNQESPEQSFLLRVVQKLRIPITFLTTPTLIPSTLDNDLSKTNCKLYILVKEFDVESHKDNTNTLQVQLTEVADVSKLDRDYLILLFPRRLGFNPMHLKIFKRTIDLKFSDFGVVFPENVVFVEWEPETAEITSTFVLLVYCSPKQVLCLRRETPENISLADANDGNAQVKFDLQYKRSSRRHYNYKKHQIGFDLPSLDPKVILSLFRQVEETSLRDNVLYRITPRIDVLLIYAKIQQFLNATGIPQGDFGFKTFGGIAGNIYLDNYLDNVNNRLLFFRGYEDLIFFYFQNTTSSLAESSFTIFQPIDPPTIVLFSVSGSLLYLAFKFYSSTIAPYKFQNERVFGSQHRKFVKMSAIFTFWNLIGVFLIKIHSSVIGSFVVEPLSPERITNFKELFEQGYIVSLPSSEFYTELVTGRDHLFKGLPYIEGLRDKAQNISNVASMNDWAYYDFLMTREKTCAIEERVIVKVIEKELSLWKPGLYCFAGKIPMKYATFVWQFYHPNAAILYKIVHQYFAAGIIDFFHDLDKADSKADLKYLLGAFKNYRTNEISGRMTKRQMSVTIVEISGIFCIFIIILYIAYACLVYEQCWNVPRRKKIKYVCDVFLWMVRLYELITTVFHWLYQFVCFIIFYPFLRLEHLFSKL
ncbi:unnamed protein product [Allacma fusca]|uniref:Uncharacterized protein n=1 Tax=Allacma fusca TaxID=39272 RepID=A0A8J2KT22_9HEXA|nr:unnamed protein product [Allacma fusca]